MFDVAANPEIQPPATSGVRYQGCSYHEARRHATLKTSAKHFVPAFVLWDKLAEPTWEK